MTVYTTVEASEPSIEAHGPRGVQACTAGTPRPGPRPPRHPVTPVSPSVEDDTDLGAVLATLLAGAGSEVGQAGNGVEALEIARRDAVAAIVTDYVMPELDGEQLAVRLRADPATAEIPLLLLTGTPLDQKRERLAELFDEVMEEPVDSAVLLALLKAVA